VTARRRGGAWLAPLLAGARSRDRLVSALGATLGVAITTLIAWAYAPAHALPYVAGSLGSSTVLLFVVPSSPMTSPWAVVGGSILSAASGVAMVHWLGATALAAGLAVGLAILLMSAARCLHPPGGGYALAPLAAGPMSEIASWHFPLVPVGVNAVLLVLCAVVFHRFSGHSYPHRITAMPDESRFQTADVDAALAELGETFDVTREDLDRLLEAAERHARKRRIANRTD